MGETVLRLGPGQTCATPLSGTGDDDGASTLHPCQVFVEEPKDFQGFLHDGRSNEQDKTNVLQASTDRCG